MKQALILLALVPTFALAQQRWENSPYNWNNNASNWDNSSANYKNSPQNWENNPYNYNSNNGIYNEKGERIGYERKTPTTTNFYDNNGNRRGYK